MLNKLEQFIKKNFAIPEKDINNEQLDERLKIATAVLFLEMAYIDFNVNPEEEKQITKTLTELFQLSNEQVQELVQMAWEERKDKHDIWTFAGLVKENFNRDQKLEIIEKLWMLIFADGKVDKFEDRLIRKISSLLGLEHGEMITAKLKVKNQLNIE